MKIKTILVFALLCLVALPAVAESPYIYGWHFWRDGANIDCGGGGKAGWICELNQNSAGMPDVEKFKRMADEGHTIIMRVDWAPNYTFPPSASDYDTYASRYAFWVEKLKDYCHIWIVGNEEFMNYDCFRTLRKAIHAIQPEAIFCPGSPHSKDMTMSILQDYVDGMVVHTESVSWVNEVDSGYVTGKTKPLYITEFAGAPPNTATLQRTVYNAVGQHNLTHPHKIECATRFVYYEYGNDYAALQMQPMQNMDFCEATLVGYTNSYSQPYLTIGNISVAGASETTAQVSWTTDAGATAQVEYWEDKELAQHWSNFVDSNNTIHSVTLTGLIPGKTYHYQVKSYRSGRPLTITQVQTFVHQPPTSGTITGYVKQYNGTPVEEATVTRTPGGYTYTTDETGRYTIAGCAAGSYTISVSSPRTSSASKTVSVSAGETVQTDISVAPKVNYLTNGSFESDLTGWTSFSDAPKSVSSTNWFGGIAPRTGAKFIGREANYAKPNGGAYQRVTGLASGNYTFTVFAHNYHGDNPYRDTKHRIGIDPTGGTDPTSILIKWCTWDYNFWHWQSEWKQLVTPTASVTGGACTVFIQYTDTIPDGWHVHAFDDAVLAGSALQTQTVASVSAAKTYADGVPVQISNVIATTNKGAVASDVIYVEDADRTSGIRVVMTGLATAVVEGNKVNVIGVLATDGNGERFISATSVTVSAGTAVKPLAMTNKAIGGGDKGYEVGPPSSGQLGVASGVGLNNVGLLVRTTGQVVSTGTGYVMISDGSPNPLKVDTSRVTNAPAQGASVTVTGVVSLDAGVPAPSPVIRPRGNADIN